MKLYIAGPMTGKPLWNFPAFFEAEEKLKEHGHEVVNPARVDEELGLVKVFRVVGPASGTTWISDVVLADKFTWKDAIARDLTLIDACDGVFLLDGWSSSLGARIERDHAKADGKPTFLERFGYDVEAAIPITREQLDALRFPAEDETNPKDLVGRSKPQIHLVPPVAVVRMAKVMELGAAKYGAYNWREKAVGFSAYTSAALRHLYAAMDGEDVDPESGQSHLAHAAACMAIVLDADETGCLIDDRLFPGAAGDLIKELTDG